MAYLNMNNMCTFEGRLVADPELSYLQGTNTAKCRIKIAVDRNMTKDAKAKAQQEGKETADFIPVDVIGPKAEFVSKYFSKGSGIRAVASFRTYKYNGSDGKPAYGYNFDAVDVGFTVGGSGNGNGNNNNNNSGGNNDFSGLDPQGFQSIDDDDLPF